MLNNPDQDPAALSPTAFAIGILIDGLRKGGVEDAEIVATLCGAATGLIRDLPNHASWAVYFSQLAATLVAPAGNKGN